MTTKLYTAAEARRIDIERGGEGWIINEHTERTYRHDDTSLVWRLVSSDIPVDQGEAFVKDCWYPANPEPEKPWSDKSQSELKIEQLEKELAEATQNYHEILADHGELTQKFDELKENSIRKDILKTWAWDNSENVNDGEKIFGAVSIRKILDFILKSKYEADL